MASKEKRTKDTVETTTGALERDGDVEVEKFDQHPVEDKKVTIDGESGFVEVSLGLTLRLTRQYEMARVDVKVRMPCKPGTEDETYTKARAFCAERIRAQWREIREQANQEVKVKRRDD